MAGNGAGDGIGVFAGGFAVLSIFGIFLFIPYGLIVAVALFLIFGGGYLVWLWLGVHGYLD